MPIYANDGSLNVTVVGGGAGGGGGNVNPGADYAKDTKQPTLVSGRVPVNAQQDGVWNVGATLAAGSATIGAVNQAGTWTVNTLPSLPDNVVSTYNITNTVTQTGVLTTGYGSVLVEMTGTFTGIIAQVEASTNTTNGIDGTWTALVGLNPEDTANVPTNTLLSGAAGRRKLYRAQDGVWVRLNVTSYGTGTAVVNLVRRIAPIAERVSYVVNFPATQAVSGSVNANNVGNFVTTPPTLTNGQQALAQISSNGSLFVDLARSTLPAFAAIPTFKVDQTTPGTTNGVVASSSVTTTDSTGTLTAATNAALTAASTTRQLLIVSNTGTTNSMMLRFGSAATATAGHPIGPGSTATFDAKCPTGQVNLFSTNGTTYTITAT